MLREAFARRLRALMKEHGISRTDLARQLEVHEADVARWLAGSLPIRPTMNRLADALQVSPSWLEGGAGKRETMVVGRQNRDYALPSVQKPAFRIEVAFEHNEHISQDYSRFTLTKRTGR